MFSCANPVTPTGGIKDTIAPNIKRASPENKSINARPKKIAIEFDEYISLDNPNNNISISPPILESLSYQIKNKALEINLQSDSLYENTTYTINFGEAIKDNNEGNVQDSFKYIFSTGPYLDSLSLNGKVVLSESGEPAENYMVCLYKNHTDSIIFKNKPYYYTKSQKDGSYTFENLKEGNYKIVAFKDENLNLKRDLTTEDIAFSDTIIEITEKNAPINLKAFTENQKIKLETSDSKNTGFIQLAFSKPLNSLKINQIGGSSFQSLIDTTIFYNKERDTIRVYYSECLNKKDTFEIVANNEELFDTIITTYKHSTKDSIIKNSINLGLLKTLDNSRKKGLGKTSSLSSSYDLGLKNHEEEITVSFNSPIISIDTSKIRVIEDSIIRFGVANFSLKNKFQVVFHVKQNNGWKQGAKYEISMKDSTIKDYLGRYNNVMSVKFRSSKKEEYGSLLITIDSLNSKEEYIANILGEDKKIIKKENIKNQSKVTIEYKKFLPGKYTLKIINDVNKNGKWDTGNYYQLIQPEQITLFNEPIEIRAKWENEIKFILNASVKKKKL